MMDKEFNKEWILATMILLIAASLTYTAIRYIDVSYHEAAHKAAFKYVGVDSNVEIYAYGLNGGKTIPLAQPTRDLTNLELANAITESIGYQLLPPLETLIVLQVILILSILMRGGVSG